MTPNCNRPCKSCIHYMRKPFGIFNECALFRERDVVTGEIVYRTAAGCRRDETRCGIEGKHYQLSDRDNFKANKRYVIPLLLLIYHLLLKVFFKRN